MYLLYFFSLRVYDCLVMSNLDVYFFILFFRKGVWLPSIVKSRHRLPFGHPIRRLANTGYQTVCYLVPALMFTVPIDLYSFFCCCSSNCSCVCVHNRSTNIRSGSPAINPAKDTWTFRRIELGGNIRSECLVLLTLFKGTAKQASEHLDRYLCAL